MLKIGDKLVCKSRLLWTGLGIVPGAEYIVLEKDIDFVKIGVEGGVFGWYESDKIYSNFYTIVELRKIKLEKLNG